MARKTWLITGISSGLGKAMAESALAHGDYVIGTVRTQDDYKSWTQRFGANGEALMLDLQHQIEIPAKLDAVLKKHPSIDVLVNNAGYGLAGAIEETGEAEARAIFDVHFFGVMALTQAILPVMRKAKSGHIIQISSHGGFKAFAGFGIYNASKFALEGMSEALAQEVAPLGIKVTIVEPGPFRTAFAGNRFILAEKQLPDYAATSGVFRERIKGVDGKQEGDPAKAAETIWEMVNRGDAPMRLPLGKIALASIRAKLASVEQDLENYALLAEAAVF